MSLLGDMCKPDNSSLCNIFNCF